MSQILGTLLDSAGFPLTGKLRVSLTGTLVNDIDTPDSINLTKPHLFDITNGVINIDLDESETSKVTYRFEFFETDVDDNLIEPALLDFYALVPNLSPIQFASLTPTGMVNDVLDTGALRVARIISSNPNLAANIGGPFPKGNWSAGTTYIYRDLVNYLNRTYISKSITPITGVLPTDTNYWMNIPVEPNGTLILGDDTPYGVAWSGSGLATSQNAVYDAIQTVNSSIALKANLISPTFTGTVIVPNQTAGSNNTRAANTAYVDSGLVNAFKPVVLATRNTNQTLTAGDNIVVFNNELLDSDNCYNPTTGVITVPEGKAGLYFIAVSLPIQFVSSTLGVLSAFAFIRVGGITVVQILNLPLPQQSLTANVTASGSVILNLPAGATVDTRLVVNNSGSSPTFSLWGADVPRLSFIRIPS